MKFITREDDISVLPLSVRSLNGLRGAKIYNVGKLLDYPQDELINIRNMGRKSVEEIKYVLNRINEETGDYQLVNNEEHTQDNTNPANNPNANEIPISYLFLSTRAANCLKHAHIFYISQLVDLTIEDLMRINSMGKKSAEEIIDKLSNFLSNNSLTESATSIISAQQSDLNCVIQELSTAYGKGKKAWMKEITAVKSKNPKAEGETFYYLLYDQTFVSRTAQQTILRILEENDDEISKVILEERMPQHLSNTTILEELLLSLETQGDIKIGEVMIYRQYSSICQYTAEIPDDRIRDVIQCRLAGKTLNEIGDQYGVTRERVRQLMQIGLKKKPRLREDQYLYIFEHYNFSFEDFKLAFEEPDETYYYLEMIGSVSKGKKKSLEDVLADAAVSPVLRKKAERAIYKQYISTDGVRVKMTRSALVKHFVKTYCKSLTDYDVFFQKYHEWLDILDLGDNQALTIESRTYENKLNQCDYVLWNQWRSFRYYNIPEHDFEELLSTLDLEQFEDTELSTLKLFRDFPDLMKQYDIHDEYELHNLLKKIWSTENDSVKFKKMPTIEIGSADPENQVLTLLLQYAPVTADDLANYYEKEYGVKAMTVKGNYLRSLDHYYYQGVYSVDFAALPVIQFNRMKAILDRDFYTIQDVKRLYKREFPHSDESLINPYTLKTLDFRVYSGYVVKNTYSTAADYFRSLLTTDEIVDGRNINKSIQNVVAYYSELYNLRANYEIVEFAPLQYINIRRLNAAGITTAHFEKYCKAVSRCYEKGEYFTVTSLRKDGFTHDLDDLGFDEWFYASVLLEDRECFSYQRIGGTRIFLRGKAGANLGDMLVWLLEKYQKIDIYDLTDLLENHYGIILPKEKLYTIISGAELYYDSIMEAVYIDYDTYFEEI